MAATIQEESIVHVYSDTNIIPLGRQCENEAQYIRFDLSEFINEFGEGTATLVHMRPSDTLPYLCDTQQSAAGLMWTLTRTDTMYAGRGQCELRWAVGDTLAKSKVYKTEIIPSIVVDTTIPAPYESWYESLLSNIEEYAIAEDEISAISERVGYVSILRSNVLYTREQALAAIDTYLAGQAQGKYTTYINGQQAYAMGLPNTAYHFTIYSYGNAYKMIVAIPIDGSAVYQLAKNSGTWESTWTQFVNQTATTDLINSLKDYATPEMYGAIGDGTTDDTAAIQNCINSNPGKTIVLSKKYLVSQTIKTSATEAEKVMLKGVQNGKIIADDNFDGSWVIDICGIGTRTGLVNTSSTTGVENLIIDTNGVCGGVLIERCHLARVKNCVITNLGGYVGLQLDKPSETDGINSSDAYIDNIIIVGQNSNVAGCTGMVINGHDNDVSNIRMHYVNIGVVINGSHNRITNAHPVRGAADSGYTVYETSKAFVVNNNFTYLTDCYSDNFAVGVDVKAGKIFYLTNFSLLWWENLNVSHTFIKLENDGETLASSKVFWGHVKGADLLFKTNGTNKGIDGDFHANTFTRNPNCLSSLYIDGSTYVSGTDPIFDKRLSDIKIDDYNYAATEITNLSSIAEGTSGRARFNASTSPTGEAGVYIYECIGDSTRKILNAYYPSTKKRYINSFTGSWTGWVELT